MSRKNSVPSRVSQNKGVLKLSERFGCQYFSPLHDLANWRKFEYFSTLFCPSFIFQASLKGLRLTPCEGVGGWFPLGALLPPQPDGSRRLRLIWVDNSKFTILVIFLRKEATKNEKKNLSRFWSRFFLHRRIIEQDACTPELECNSD